MEPHPPSQPAVPEHAAVVLAGGAGRRLGGVDKSQLRVAGRPLLEHVLDAVGPARATVVVGNVAVPAGVLRTVERPPGSGPAAGLGAGVDAVREHLGALPQWVLVLAVDQPGAPGAVPAVLAAAARAAGDVDAVCHRDSAGHPQWLLAAYRGDALVRALAAQPLLAGCSVRRLVQPLRFGQVSAGAEHLGDIDTPDDLRAWRVRLGGCDDG